jgi:NTE family protein
MQVNILDDPDVREELEAIRAFASTNVKALDTFFWLAAVASRADIAGDREPLRDPPPPFKLFRSNEDLPAAAGDGQRLRIANIVLQGGGVLGLAHAGFVAGLETAGVRFAGTAGASAGAIMAIAMAAVRGTSLLEPTHPKVVRIVGSMPMEAFIDGPYRVRWLIKQLLLKRKLYRHPGAWAAAAQAFKLLLRRRGLNPGSVFEEWLVTVLDEHQLSTVDELKANLNEIGKHLQAASRDSPSIRLNLVDSGNAIDLLQIMAACMPLGVKFQFPKDADVLEASLQQGSPAALVRASMSIPLFFEPTVFNVNAARWPRFVRDKLGKLVGTDKLKEFAELDDVAFLDGGIFSNLPADAFRDVMTDVPTIVVPLISSRAAAPFRRSARLSTLTSEVGAVAFMVRNQRDYDAIDQIGRARDVFEKRLAEAKTKAQRAVLPPTFPFRLAPMDVGEFNWLNFTMEDSEMIELFLIGVKRARRFLSEDLSA